jgi:beta-glucanase (GH16 family)
MLRRLFLFGVGILGIHIAGSSQTAAGFSPENYRLIFQDDFNGSELDTSLWNYRQENVLRHGSVVLRANVIVGDGMVRLVAGREGNVYSSAMISTENSHWWKYGYFECRARLNRSPGPTASFWLQSPAIGATNDPGKDGTEVDVFEYNLNSGGKDLIQHNLHWNGYGANHQTTGSKEHIEGISEGWHVFGLLWTSGEYIVYVDGVERARTAKAVSHREEYVVLSNLVTDDGFGGDRSAGTYPDYFDVDYVKIYAPKP